MDANFALNLNPLNQTGYLRGDQERAARRNGAYHFWHHYTDNQMEEYNE